MKTGKNFLIIIIVFFSATGFLVIQEFPITENLFASVDDNSSQDKKITVKVSDGVGTSSKG